MSLAEENKKLKEALTRRANRGLSLRIDELWAERMGLNSTLIQLIVVASNDGEEITASDWSLVIHIPKHTYGIPLAFGRQRMKGLPEVGRLDEMFYQPVGILDQRPGYLSFVTERLSVDEIEKFCHDHSVEIRVSAWDSLGRAVGSRQDVSELKVHFVR